MLVLSAIACLAVAPLLQTPSVQKVNGPLAGDVSTFTWTPDGRYVVYGAARNSLGIDVVTSMRVADRSEAVYDPFAYLLGSARTVEFAFLPDRELVGARVRFFDSTNYPPVTGEPMYILDRSSALRVSNTGLDPRFLEDGRMTYRTVTPVFHGWAYERAWIGRWDGASPPLEVSPPALQGNHVSLVLPAPQAGVAVFGWRDTFTSPNNAELFKVPLGGGALVPLIPPPPSGQRGWVDAVHVRTSDELVIYMADETSAFELWGVPVDGSLPPRRLNPPLAAGRVLYPARVSPDEARIVFVTDVEVAGVLELWSTDIDTGTSVRLSGPMATGGDAGSDDFWISPDSTRVVYRADQRADEVFELFSAPIDGHTPAVSLHGVLPADRDALRTVHFTPDGNLVVFAIRLPRGVALLAGLADGSGPPRVLNWPFPQGGGVLEGPWGILSSVAITRLGSEVFFLGEQDTNDVVELYSVPIDASATALKWNAPLVAGGDVTDFAVRPSPAAVLYRADQDVDEHFELYSSERPHVPPRDVATGAPAGAGTVTVPD